MIISYFCDKIKSFAIVLYHSIVGLQYMFDK